MQRTKPRPANPEAQGIDVEIVGAKQVRGLHFVRSDHDRVHKDRKGAAAANGPSGKLCLFACQEHVVSFGADVRSS